ncbi:diguanylate cyclase domain-containing protein [Cupriavidus basilensis]
MNDTYGHPVGDKLLNVVATRLKSCVGETGAVARVGGDEFAVIFGGRLDVG